MRCVVTGASRGIGLEFVRQLLGRGDVVEAGARAPEAAKGLTELRTKYGDALRLHACDVLHDASVDAFAAALSKGPVDLVLSSVANMLKVIDGLTLDDTGTFQDHTGKTRPW